MKKLLVLVCMVGMLGASDLIPFDRVAGLAQKFVTDRFGPYVYDSYELYHGIDGQPGAYAFTFRNAHNEPLTVIMGARYTTTPVNEIYKDIPRSVKAYQTVLSKARSLGTSEPVFLRRYYFGPGEEYCAFDINGTEVLINGCTFRHFQKSWFTDNLPEPDPELESIVRNKWQTYFSVSHFSTRDSNYVANVPFIDWVYGCSPTAASMIFWYWDEYAPTPMYGTLIDHFFTRWDEPESEWNDCANVNKELSIAMYTDSMTGSTTLGNIGSGMITVANSWHGFTCASQTSPQGNSGNQYVFYWARTEIDAARPFHWNVLNYWYDPFSDWINHSVTGVGYLTAPGDTFIQVHNTWDTNEPYWALWTYHSPYTSFDRVVTFIPGGGISDNLFMDWPIGGGLYSPQLIFENIKYRVRWSVQGSNIDHLKMWYAEGRQADDSLGWTVIADNIPVSPSEYIWTCPASLDTLRINISGMNSGNTRLAADGCFGRLVPTTLNHTSGIDLIGHIPTDDGVTQAVDLANDHLYIADGTNGLVVADISDPTIPEVIGHLALPGNSCCIDVSGQYAYIGDDEDTLRVILISDPANPSQQGVCAVGAEALGVHAVGSFVYVAARTEGLVVVDVSSPSAPGIHGQYNTPGFSYDVVVDGDYAYVADATQGVRIIDVSDPQNPDETGYYNTNGISYGVTKQGNYVYAADGTQGIKVFDASSPDTLELLGSLDTPGTAKKVKILNNGLFVADGDFNGVRVIDVSTPGSPSDIGNIESKGASYSLFVTPDSLVYLADGLVGVLVIEQSLVGIQEHTAEIPTQFSMGMIPTHIRQDKSVNLSVFTSIPTRVDVSVFDCAGRLVESLYSGTLDPGIHTLQWQPRGFAAGIYFVKAETSEHKTIQKIVVVR
jgi:hypothetical protein